MGAVATFNFAAWQLRYPEFSTTVTSEDQALLYWSEATLYCDNSGCGPVSDLTIQTTLLNMLTAHIAKLAVGINGQPATPLVGRISDASEGSVSVSAQYDASNREQWFAQTQYGVAFWGATMRYRQARYHPRPRPIYAGFYRGGW